MQFFSKICHKVRIFIQPRVLYSSKVGLISRKEFAQRRENLIKCIHNSVSSASNSGVRSLIILPSAEVQYRSLHVPHTFHQDSYFRYFTGFLEADSILCLETTPHNLITTVQEGVSYTPRLFVDIRDEHSSQWDGPTLGVDGSQKLTGIREVQPLSTFHHYLASVVRSLGSSGILWYATPFLIKSGENVPIYTKVLDMISSICLELNFNMKNLKNPHHLMDELRVLKSETEITLLSQAANLTAHALRKTMRKFYDGVMEAHLSSDFEHQCKRLGFCLGYPSVVAGGPRANIIHYLANCQRVEEGQLVLMDVGAEVEGYTADVTRTWPVNGLFSDQQRVLHEILVTVQEDCRRAVNFDNSLCGVYNVMLNSLSKYLVQAKIIRSNEIKLNVTKICPHHVGHFLGLDVHDTPNIPYSRNFQPGMVFPLEPGIYLPEAPKDFHVPEEFRGIAIRLEDDFVITPSGIAKILTNKLPTSSVDIESHINCSVPLSIDTSYNDAISCWM